MDLLAGPSSPLTKPARSQKEVDVDRYWRRTDDALDLLLVGEAEVS
jgi:hypothetical protein